MYILKVVNGQLHAALSPRCKQHRAMPIRFRSRSQALIAIEHLSEPVLRNGAFSSRYQVDCHMIAQGEFKGALEARSAEAFGQALCAYQKERVIYLLEKFVVNLKRHFVKYHQYQDMPHDLNQLDIHFIEHDKFCLVHSANKELLVIASYGLSLKEASELVIS